MHSARLLPAIVGVAVVAAACVWTTVAPAGETQRSCTARGVTFPGGGPLEWKPSGRFALRVRGLAGTPVATTGSTLIVSGVEQIAGNRRRGLAAIDMRSDRVLPF